uniref:Uncharacterized protein n=1 Tax=Plectus sambesii TaxID=2011161 RepID=A0A914WEG4_9BILA
MFGSKRYICERSLLLLCSIFYLSVSSNGEQCYDFSVKLTDNITVDEIAASEEMCDRQYCWSMLTTYENNQTGATKRWAKGGCTSAYICEQFASECVYGADDVMATEMGRIAVEREAKKRDAIVTPNSICCCKGDRCNTLALLLVAHTQQEDNASPIASTEMLISKALSPVHAGLIGSVDNSGDLRSSHGVRTEFSALLVIVQFFCCYFLSAGW